MPLPRRWCRMCVNETGNWTKNSFPERWNLEIWPTFIATFQSARGERWWMEKGRKKHISRHYKNTRAPSGHDRHTEIYIHGTTTHCREPGSWLSFLFAPMKITRHRCENDGLHPYKWCICYFERLVPLLLQLFTLSLYELGIMNLKLLLFRSFFFARPIHTLRSHKRQRYKIVFAYRRRRIWDAIYRLSFRQWITK